MQCFKDVARQTTLALSPEYARDGPPTRPSARPRASTSIPISIGHPHRASVTRAIRRVADCVFSVFSALQCPTCRGRAPDVETRQHSGATDHVESARALTRDVSLLGGHHQLMPFAALASETQLAVPCAMRA